MYVRLEHFEDSRNFLGAEGSEELVRGVARRAERRVGADGRAFRVRPDSLVLVLPGLSLAEAREAAADLAHEVSGSLIAGRRQTLATGASSFPTVRRIEDLLAAARDEALAAPAAGRGRRHGRPTGRRAVVGAPRGTASRPLRRSTDAGRDGPRLATPHAPR